MSDGLTHLAVSRADERGLCGAPETEWHTLRMGREVTCRACRRAVSTSPDFRPTDLEGVPGE